MIEYAERLAKAMKAREVKTSQLAREIGVSYQAVKRVLDGLSNAFSAVNNAKAASALGISPDWLATGEGQMDLPQSAGAASQAEGASGAPQSSEVGDPIRIKSLAQLPLVGEVKGGPDGFLEELQYPVGHGEGTVEYPTADPEAYALRVRGDSMHPRYRAGEFVIVEPSIAPQEGDDVVVVCRKGRKMLKQLNWRRDGEVQLLSINDGYEPLTLKAGDIVSMHLAAGRARRSALKRD